MLYMGLHLFLMLSDIIIIDNPNNAVLPFYLCQFYTMCCSTLLWHHCAGSTCVYCVLLLLFYYLLQSRFLYCSVLYSAASALFCIEFVAYRVTSAHFWFLSPLRNGTFGRNFLSILQGPKLL